jgi:DNA-binding YbaB/EbfC family protein
VEGASGNGLVTARVNGRGELRSVRIDPKVVDPANVELLEDLVKAALRQAGEKSRDLMQQEMGKVLGGLGIPGIENVMGMF